MIERIAHDKILELRMARPPVNAISPEFCKALLSALRDAPGEGFRAAVISGAPGMFSAGLDVPALLQLDRAGIIAFWGDFFQLMAVVARSPIPTVAAITGHSPAGGAVISIFCDYRVMARGNFKIGLNEVQVGLVVPEVIQLAFKRLLGAHRAERMMVAGAMIDPEAALQIGLVDELAEVDQVIPQALAWCQKQLALPTEAMSGTRRLARRDLADIMGDATRYPADAFADSWFGEETQATLQAMVAKLKAKKG
ncbi:MAG: enoyl-CoA hydratase/isomerase family protein [Pseudomonadota bacterium]|nr:enoyl-CoA hydratase/isomerase family protein [Pseudomonadota bacterium]